MPKLIIASGENSLAAELLAIDCKYTMQPLPLADAVIRGDEESDNPEPLVMVERKTIRDLLASIKDGRYKEQGNRLFQMSCPVWWIIEGTLSRYSISTTEQSMVFGAIATLGLIKGFTPVRTTSTAETATLLRKLLDKCEQYKLSSKKEETKKIENNQGTDSNSSDAAPVGASKHSLESIPHKRFKADCITKRNIEHLMLAQIPGVSVARAEAILAVIPLKDILAGKPIPTTIKCLSNTNSASTPRAIPKNVISTIQDYLQPKQQDE